MTGCSPTRRSTPPMTTTHADYRLSQLDELEAESIHIFREVAAEFEKPVLMFSGGKDSIVMMRLAEKAFYPAKIPFPVLQVDTGYDFPEVLATRDNWVNRLGVRLIVATVEEAIANGVVVDDGKTSPQPAPDRHPAQRSRGGGLHRRLRRRPPRRGEGPRQGARLLPPRRVRPVGPQEPAPRAVEPLQRPDPRGRAHADLPDLATGPSSTSGTTSAARGSRSPSIYFSHQRRVFQRDGMLLSESRVQPVPQGRDRRGAHGPVPHRRRPDADRLRGVRGRDHPPRSSTRSRSPGSPSAAPPVATTGSPRPPWKTARRRATSDGRAPCTDWPAGCDLLRFATAGSRRRRQVHAHRAAAARLQGDLRGPARGRRGHLGVQGLRLHRPRAAHRRPALRARAGHHHRRGLPLLRDARTASSSSPTPRATCSTPATWSPAPRPPTSAWCSSTPARA